jgi:hypothetical protein
MSKIELTEDQKDFVLDPLTLNNQLIYWLTKAKCMWNLKETNKKYKELRISMDHATVMEGLKRQMFLNGLK